MFQAYVKFRSKDNHISELSNVFDDYRSAQKYIAEFPNVVVWSISPLKILAPIAKSGQDFSVVINHFDLLHNRDVINDIGIDGIQDYIKSIDINNTSEIHIKLLRWK